jgi:hypothetical protein
MRDGGGEEGTAAGVAWRGWWRVVWLRRRAGVVRSPPRAATWKEGSVGWEREGIEDKSNYLPTQVGVGEVGTERNGHRQRVVSCGAWTAGREAAYVRGWTDLGRAGLVGLSEWHIPTYHFFTLDQKRVSDDLVV